MSNSRVGLFLTMALLGATMATASGRALAVTAPVAKDQSMTTVEGAQRQYLYLSFTDPDVGETRTFTLVTAPAHGKLEYNNGTWHELSAGSTVTTYYWWYYTPDAGYTGTDTFTWEMSDGTYTSNTATCTITVNANTVPVAKNQSETMVEGVQRRTIYLSYTDPDSAQTRTFTLVTAPAHGKLEHYSGGYQTLNPGDGSSYYYWYYTPDAGYTGSDAFTWKVSDGMATSGTATCSVTINANTAPVAKNSNVAVVKDTTTTIPASFVDPDAQTFTLTVVSGPAHGSVAASGANFNYTPSAGYTGADSFTWKVSDGAVSSGVVTCSILVRNVNSRAGMLVALVVNDLLYPEIETEVDRLKADLVAEGYTAKIKTLAGSTSQSALWSYLEAEYRAPGQFMAGAILIGSLPKGPYNSTSNQMTDCSYWNMDKMGDVTKRHIWVSRMWALSGSGGDLFAGDEVTLLKRALNANHDARTGAHRLPHTAHYYEIFNGDAYMYRLEEIWPATEYLTPHLAWAAGGDVLHETSHGGPGAYANMTYMNTYRIHDQLAQVRFGLCSSCVSGAFGGVVNNQLFTRGGGNIFSVGAAYTTYDGAFELADNWGSDTQLRGRLAAGDTWGNSLVAYYNAFSDCYRAFYYGDLSLPVMPAPANQVPVVSSLTASVTSGAAPLTVDFTASASDPDGSITTWEWWPTGHYYGKVEPTVSGAAITSTSYTFSKPYRYGARVEVVDNYKARAWKEVEIRVAPQPGQTLRVNCGRAYTGYATPWHDPALEHTDSSSQLWFHDQRYVDGTWGGPGANSNVYPFSGDVLGTTDDVLYHYHIGDYYRTGFTYKIPLPNGGYTVKMGFCDMKNTAAGQRLADVTIEGQPQLTAFDIVGTFGAKTPGTVSKHVDLSDGMLEIFVKTNPAGTATGNNGMAVLNTLEIVPDGGSNTPPTISDIADQTTDEDVPKGPVSFTVGDAETSAGALVLTKSSSNPALVPAGNIVFGGSGASRTVTITPAADEHGSATVTVTVTDGGGLSAADSFVLTVSPKNDAPVAQNQSVTTPEDTSKAITLAATDVDGDPLTYSIVTPPAHGTLSGTAPNVTYIPAADYNGPDSFTFRARDGVADSNLATVSVTVTPVNDPPVAHSQNVTAAEDTPKDITLSATDVDGDPLAYSIVTGPAHGALTGTPPNVTYIPSLNYNGADSFVFKVEDGKGGSDGEGVNITVTAVNDLPVISTASPGTPFTMAAGTAQTFEISAHDDDGDALSCSWEIDGAPAGVTDTDLDYSPTAADVGGHTITVTVSDGKGGSDSHTWSVTVTSASPDPAIGLSTAALAPSCVEGSNAPGQAFTVQNVGGGTLSWSVSDNASWLSCSPTAGTSTGEADTVSVGYATSGLAAGTHSATITVSGGAGVISKTIAVTLTVSSPPPDPSIACSTSALSPSCTQGGNAAAQTFTVRNAGGGTLNWSVSDNASWLSCSPASGTSTGEEDTVTVSYAASGLAAGTYSAEITVTAAGATNSPQTLNVILTVKSAGGGGGGGGSCALAPGSGSALGWWLPYLLVAGLYLLARLRRRNTLGRSNCSYR